MAQKVLNNLLDFKILPKDIVSWLTEDELDDTQLLELDKNCTKEEFITFYLNYLRDQFTGILPINTATKQTPAKKILPVPRIIKTLEPSTDLVKNPSTQLNTNSIGPCSSPIQVDNEKDKTSKNIQRVSSPQINTPSNTSRRKRVELISSTSQGQGINPAFNESFEYDQSQNIRGSLMSSNDIPLPNIGYYTPASFCTSNVSANFGMSELSESYNSSLSQKSNSSISNNVFQSPVSPLYSNSLSMLSPINNQGSQNRSKNSPCNNSYYHNNTSTPERSSNSVSHHSKNSSRQNLSLGDFITTDSRSSKKSHRKRNNSKILQKYEQKNSKEQSTVACNITTTMNSEQNIRKRKVNPTRLNVTDEKDCKENTVFGVLTRPFTQNPQFVDVAPIEKSAENSSIDADLFQVERVLMKMEREKNPESTKNTDIITTDEQNQPRLKILPRTPSKVIKPSSIIVPNKLLVYKPEVLDVLAELYSGFLDHNLVVNPMTELYLIIQLITTQYVDDSEQFSNAKKMDENSDSQDADHANNFTDIRKNLSALRKSLNFDSLCEGIDANQNADNSYSDMFIDDIKHLNLDGCVINSNYITDHLEHLKINKTSDGNITNQGKEEIQETDNIKNSERLFLNTPHNCVYFSSQVLNHQKVFLRYLDRVTLKLLCDNNHLTSFQPELCKYLDSIYSLKVAESNKSGSFLNIRSAELNVCFQIDTDNREKFSSHIAFQSFKKQRDMFYEVLKIWEDNHSVPGWTFQIALSGKIKTILSMYIDITNFTHITRLFKSQMLISCIQSGQQEDSLDKDTANFLKDLNPQKLTQLQRKLVTPSSQNGPVPPPSFPGIQEFYKDFILYASNSMFYTYLEDTLIHEIMELNNSTFLGSDIEETETEVDEYTKENFVVCLSSLRLLAKFLGFVTSLPYRSETSMQEDVIASQVQLRSMCLPRIDLQFCLQSALVQGKLSLTIPWIVEYLAQMDPSSLRIPYYKRVLEILYCIYRASYYQAMTNPEESMSQRCAVLMKLAIGWLFDLPVFPKELYYSYQSKYTDKTLKIICESQRYANKFECSLAEIDLSVISVKPSLFLDKLEIIDDRILYSCCPFLRELNILLTPGNSSVNNTNSYRHVTPITSHLQKTVKKTSTKNLEIQLEEAFFHGQPDSTRKTVEYVAERVASTCVKYIHNELLPVAREKNVASLKLIIEQNFKDEFKKKPESLKIILMKDINLLSMKAVTYIKEKSEQVIPKICETRVNKSIEALLAEDCLESVKNMCTKIAIRMATERIDQWIQSRIMGGSVFVKDMEVELNRAFKPVEGSIIDRKFHNSNAANPTDTIKELRTYLFDLIENQGRSMNIECLSGFGDRLYESLTERCDLKSLAEEIILSSSVDLCLFLIIYRDDLLTNEVQNKIFKTWKLDRLKLAEDDSILSRLLSTRNVNLLEKSLNHNIWLVFGKFLKELLKQDILSIGSLSTQAVALFRREWSTQMTKNLSICLREAIDGYKSSDEETARIRELLEWVAWTYNNMDRDNFD